MNKISANQGAGGIPILLSMCVSVLLGLFPQYAQSEGAVIEEIVVKATRRSASLNDVPIAISALSAESLRDGGVFETTDLNRVAPNFQVSSPYGTQQPNFSLRGVGVGTEFNANAASPVGVYVDEVYQAFRASHGQQLYDLDQVEVVRGPQGTLFGRNTTGGAINFITRKPKLEGANGYVTAGVANYERRNFEGALEFTPIADQLGFRLAATYVEVDNYVDNELAAGLNTEVFGGASGLNRNTGTQPGGNENWGVRGSMRFVPTDAIDITIKAYAAESKGGTEAPIPTGSTPGSDVIDWSNPNFLLGGLFTAIDGLAPGSLPLSYSQSGNGLDIREVEQDSVGDALIKASGFVATADIAINENLSLIALIGHDTGDYEQVPTTDCDASPLALCTIGYDAAFEATNVDIRLDYANGPLKLIVGAYYGNDLLESTNQPNFFNFTRDINAGLGLPATYFNPGGAFNGAGLSAGSTPTGILATNDFDQERDSFAIYGEANYDLTNTLTLTLGLRYSDDELEYSDGLTTYFDDAGNARLVTVSSYQAGGAFAPFFLADVQDEAGNVVIPAAVVNPGPPPAGLRVKGGSDDVSGRVILDWKPRDGLMFYGSFSRGYRAGTINGLAYGTSNQVYLVDPEEVDAFEVGFKAQLLEGRMQFNGTAFWYDYDGQQGQVIDSTATANLISLDGEIKGLELDVQWLVTDKLRVSAALGLLESEYDSGDCPPGISLAGQFPGQLGSCVLSSGGEVSVGGNPFPYAPELTFNAGFDWDIWQRGEGILTLHADVSYTDEFNYDSFDDYSRGPLPNVSSGEFARGSDDFTVYNARLSWQSANYTLALWGKNLGDEEYYPFGISLENLFGNGYRVIAQPRTYGFELSYRF